MAFNAEEERIAVEQGFQTLSLGELNAEKDHIDDRIQHLQNELSDLAFHNYRTYVDVGRTAEHCKQMFVEINGFTQQLRNEFPNLLDHIKQFRDDSEKIFDEYKILDDIYSTNCLIWQILKLPKLMEKCIRAGRYEQAYALTNFAISLKHGKLTQNPILKNVVEVLIEARHNLLDELFSKFVGPIDLARSIQIVNNIRKIPYISNTQLRVSILQYRNIYMEKNVMKIMSEPDFLLRLIDVYRECMYDTIVLYLAVFPDNDIQRKFTSMNEDPRWERWTGGSQTYLLQSWAQRNIEKLFSLIRGAENKTCLDIEAMHSKLMSFAFSFGRMGLDFRLLIVHEFSQMILEICRQKIESATNRLTELPKIDLIDGDIFESTRQDIEDQTEVVSAINLGIIAAPLELCVWDDICVFGNLLIETLNEIRHSLSAIIIRPIFAIIHSSLQKICKWIDSFLTKSEHIILAKKAIFLLLRHFVPFINKCFFHFFPYEQFSQFFRASYFHMQEYSNTFKLLGNELFVLCKHDNVFTEILNDIQLQEQRENQKYEEELQNEAEDRRQEKQEQSDEAHVHSV